MKAAPLFALICLMACTLNSPARVGDSLDQCIKRWGQPVGPENHHLSPGQVGDAAYSFVTNGYSVGVVIFNKTVGGEIISKSDKSDFSETEEEALLASEANGLKWVKSTGPYGDEIEAREDAAVLCIHRISPHLICFYSNDYYVAVHNKKTEDEKAKLKNF